MRATSGTWLHAQLSLLVAACWATACGQTNSGDGADAHAGTAGVAAGNATTAGGASAQGGQGLPAGGSAQGGKLTQGGSDVSVGGSDEAPPGGASAGGASAGGAPGLICNGSAPKLTAGWQTKPALEYVALRWVSQDNTTVVEETGTLCAGASVQTECETAFAAQGPTVVWNRGAQLPIDEYFVYSRGDDVGTIGSMAELKAVLGDIDTANEAAVWLYAMNRPVQCADLQTVPDGYVGKSQQNLNDCPVTYQPVQVHLATDGTVNEKPLGAQVVTNSCAGRRPNGLSLVGARAGGPGACLAEMAELELASIAAFAELGRQLTAHGAPAELVQRCHDARRDEIEHARVVGALAQRFGAQPQMLRVAPSGPRSLFDLALENAREGCVRELYGAAAASWQAERAEDEGVRHAFARIARDESEHAALALDLDDWFRAQLDAAQHMKVEAEQQRAYAELAAQLGQTPDSEAQRVAGLPNAANAVALLAGVRGWARVA